MQPPIRNRRALSCMTDCTQEFNEASKNKVRMRIFFQSKNLYLRFFRNKRHEAFLNKKIYWSKPLFASENQTRSIFASRKGKLILNTKRRTAIHFEWHLYWPKCTFWNFKSNAKSIMWRIGQLKKYISIQITIKNVGCFTMDSLQSQQLEWCLIATADFTLKQPSVLKE